MTIKLGVIGASPGNGHPYSWSAIFNGYEVEAMQACEYPVIPEYLSEQRWPEAKITEAEVSTIWTQDIELSTRIAKASRIGHVSSTLNEMESRVDAVLLARDDAENHFELAKQFLLAGKPVYIDKPIAHSLVNLQALYGLQQYPGQIFTCSALRYGKEFILSAEGRHELGRILSISASIPNSWGKYSVHIIEPVLNMLSSDDRLLDTQLVFNSSESRTLSALWESGVSTRFSTLGNTLSPAQIAIEGKKGSINLVFKDSFAAFRAALQDYVDGIVCTDCRSPFEFNARVVDLIARGFK